jgi:phosphate transport system permease protein
MNARKLREEMIRISLFICAAFSIIFVLAILFYTSYIGRPEIISEILNGFEYIQQMFASVDVAFGATIISIAIGLPCAVYMAEFANMRVRNFTKTSLEMLDGFPSIVIGVVGWELLSNPQSPYSFHVFLVSLGMVGEGCAFFGWIILTIMSFPIIATISEDALRAVPQDLREASLGIGATRWQTTWEVLIPAAMPNIVASVLLAFAAAMGETVALTWVLGGASSFIFNPLNPLQQVTSLSMVINQQFAGMEENGAIYEPHVFASAFALFIMIGVVNIAIRIILRRGNPEMRRSL